MTKSAEPGLSRTAVHKGHAAEPCVSLIVAIFLGAPLMAQTQPKADGNATAENPGVTIMLTERNVTDKTFQLRYRISNNSAHDIWLCKRMHALAWWHFEAYLQQDGETLLVQRRLDVPMEAFGNTPTGLYIRLPAGGSRSEVMSFSLPIYRRFVLSSETASGQLVYARRLVLRIGYYDGNLPETVLSTLAEAERTRPAEPLDDLYLRSSILGPLQGSLNFTVLNEDLRARDDQVVIPWTDGRLKGERVLEVAVDNLRIPYSGQYHKPKLPDLTPCTRVEIRFGNAPLEFFFPYAQQQSLLNEKDRQYLQSLNVLEISDSNDLRALAKGISAGMDDAFLVGSAKADLICYSGNDRLTSLVAYGDATLVNEGGQVFRYIEGIPTFRRLTPQLGSLQLRVQCAANLKDLWHRLRSYGIAQYAPRNPKEAVENLRKYGYEIPPSALRERKKAYPTARRWCDALLRGYRDVCGGDDIVMLKHRCPSAGKGRSHYAMNPNCRPDSAPDTVLLFETKAGWNQHGGSELFTFDNHDPKGGCVLLNDGTVKFIRSEDEVRQLRWK